MTKCLVLLCTSAFSLFPEENQQADEECGGNSHKKGGNALAN